MTLDIVVSFERGVSMSSSSHISALLMSFSNGMKYNISGAESLFGVNSNGQPLRGRLLL
jgi:hypothetical protein